jgi:hypothetical protein
VAIRSKLQAGDCSSRIEGHVHVTTKTRNNIGSSIPASKGASRDKRYPSPLSIIAGTDNPADDPCQLSTIIGGYDFLVIFGA